VVSSGRTAATCRATLAFIAIMLRLCATVSCMSRAMRNRSSVTARAVRSSAIRSARCRRWRTSQPTDHGTATAAPATSGAAGQSSASAAAPPSPAANTGTDRDGGNLAATGNWVSATAADNPGAAYVGITPKASTMADAASVTMAALNAQRPRIATGPATAPNRSQCHQAGGPASCAANAHTARTATAVAASTACHRVRITWPGYRAPPPLASDPGSSSPGIRDRPWLSPAPLPRIGVVGGCAYEGVAAESSA